MSEATSEIKRQALLDEFNEILAFVQATFEEGGTAHEVESGRWQRMLKLAREAHKRACSCTWIAGEPLVAPEKLYIFQYLNRLSDTDMAVQPQGCTPAAYRRRSPADTPLYRAVQSHLQTFLARCRDDWEDERIAPHAARERRAYLQCGILA